MSKTFSFHSTLEPLSGNPSYTGITVPAEIVVQLPEKGRLRCKGTVNGASFNLAIQGRKNGAGFLMVGGALRRAAKIKAGMPVFVEFELVDPDELELPEELLEVLTQDEDASRFFYNLTVAKQRGLAHYVQSVKSTDSRIKRALELARKIKNGELYMQKHPD
ncbi:MAG: DUF1905 domain-containing protein [Bacteroidetes bacterium]|nr:DUF1905 domain-containing protein [Bacteroidota bacterium]